VKIKFEKVHLPHLIFAFKMGASSIRRGNPSIDFEDVFVARKEPQINLTVDHMLLPPVT
jgi:hypothetical protein